MHMCCTPYYVCVCNSSTFRRGAKQHSCSLLFCNDDCFTPSCNTVSIMLLLCTLQEAEVCSERYSVSDYTIVSSDGSISVSINASADVNNYMVTMNSANAANISRGFAYNISVIACIDISDTACNSSGCQESTQFCRESKTIEVCK